MEVIKQAKSEKKVKEKKIRDDNNMIIDIIKIII